MLPNSFPFLAFLAAIVAVYYLAPRAWRMWILLAASYYFYSTFQPLYLLLLLYATALAYIVGLVLPGLTSQRARAWVAALGIVGELGVLAVFKYADFLTGTVESALGWLAVSTEPLALPRLEFLLPVGLSFYAFSAISYIVDVKRETIGPERHPARLALYVAFFPKLLAGPIERARPFLDQIAARPFQSALFVAGLQLLIWGLFKKVVIADRLAVLVDAGFSNPDFQSPVAVLVAVYLYAFQIYCDFSGYSDMAIGAAALFGIRLMENFRRPYFATSVVEFWGRRWHISLMAWFRDYLYIPLGGNRVPRWRWYANLMIVFLVSGLWHGANWTFVIWGGLNGLYQWVYHLLTAPRRRVAPLVPDWLWKLLGVLVTFHLITFAWVFFRAESLEHAMSVFGRIWDRSLQLPSLLANYPWSAEMLTAFGLILVLLVVEAVDEWRDLWAWLGRRPIAVRWGFFYALFAMLVVIGQWNLNQFVYMNF